jgi:predicted acyl esterase
MRRVPSKMLYVVVAAKARQRQPLKKTGKEELGGRPNNFLRPRSRSLGWLLRGVALSVCFSSVLPVAWGSLPSGASTATATPWPGGKWQPDPVSYGMTIVQNIPLKMSDGVTLIANVGYPADPSTGRRVAGAFPVLLTQDPYPAETQPNGFYVTRGYINAVVQVRGTNDTYGPGGKEVTSVNFGPRQTEDGVALVHWAAKELSGSNGVVGLDGCSFLGIDQIFTAAALGPDSPVKEILPACASNDYNTYFAGGVPSQVAGLFASSLAKTLEGTKNETVNYAASQALEHQFLTGGPAAYNGSYWQERTTYNVAANIVKNKIPALLWSGWYPTDGPGSLLEYSIFQNTYDHRPPFASMTPGQKTTGRYQIVVGPWQHGQGLDQSIQLEWYDTWLKGEDTGITNTQTPMHLYDLQAAKWVNATTYPMTNAYTAYHLASGGILSRGSSKTGSATVRWGQPTVAGATLTFNSAPLASGGTIGGPIAATIYAASSNRNLELNGTLFDVSASGQSTQLATGTILGSLRALDSSRSWYDKHGLLVRPEHPYAENSYASANSVQRYDIGLTPTLYSIPAGDHLQFVLSTQAPSAKCTGAGAIASALTTPLPCLLSTPQKKTLPGGVYKVLWSPSKPSTLNVPLLSAGTVQVTTSGVTPTSNGLTEALNWNGS